MTIWNFEKLQREINAQGITTERGLFYPQAVVDRLLETLARSVPVDEQFYCAKYPDVQKAVEAGEIASAALHFAEHGFYEDRLPCDVKVDEADYLARFPDVVEGIAAGDVESATDHWLRFGRFEGRTAYLVSA